MSVPEQIDLVAVANLMPPANDEGRLRKEVGQAQALSGERGEEFHDWALAAFPTFANYVRSCGGTEFVMEDFRYWAQQQSGFVAPRSHNAWGAVATALTKKGLIRSSGRYEAARSPKTHSHPVRVWLVA